MKLNLGFSTSLPINVNADIPEYSIEETDTIQKLSSNFNSIQIMFSKSVLSSKELKNIKKIISQYKYIFVHASYQINIGSDMIPSQTDLYNSGIDILLNETHYAKKIGACGIIVHMGKNVKKKFDDDEVFNNMVKFVIEFFKKNKKNNITLIFETPAGQGGEMCYKLEDFLDFVYRFHSLPFYNQIGICIDTCHIFQAGYDINNTKTIHEIHKLLYPFIDKIKIIHLNDSYHQVGQKLDRHQQLGQGYIQIDKLIEFIKPFIKISLVLETIPPYEEQIKLIK
jgi:deoxyribonuclease-4